LEGKSHREENEEAEARGPKGPERECGLGGKGSEPPPHQLEGLGERCKLSSGVWAEPQKL